MIAQYFFWRPIWSFNQNFAIFFKVKTYKFTKIQNVFTIDNLFFLEAEQSFRNAFIPIFYQYYTFYSLLQATVTSKPLFSQVPSSLQTAQLTLDTKTLDSHKKKLNVLFDNRNEIPFSQKVRDSQRISILVTSLQTTHPSL